MMYISIKPKDSDHVSLSLFTDDHKVVWGFPNIPSEKIQETYEFLTKIKNLSRPSSHPTE